MALRRWIIPVIVCLAVGVVVNVAVAWGCVLVSRPRLGAAHHEQPVTVWNFKAPSWWPPPDFASKEHKAGVSHQWLYVKTTDSSSREFETHGISAGLPFRSLRSVWAYAWELDGSDAVAVVEPQSEYATSPFLDGMPLPSVLQHGDLKNTLLPVAPIWLGFLANTLLYAALAWCMLFAPGEARRWRRRKRGACQKCGYDLKRIAGVCPECGRGRTGAR